MNDDLEADGDEVLAGARRAFEPPPSAAAHVSASLDRALRAQAGPREPSLTAKALGYGATKRQLGAPAALLGVCVLVACGLAALRFAQAPSRAPRQPAVHATAPASGQVQDAHAPRGESEPVRLEPVPPVTSEAAVPNARRVQVAGQAASAPRVAKRKPSPHAVPLEMESLQAELQALRRVELALREGRAAQALAILAELERSVPNGRLSEERAAARVVARCALEPAARALLLQGYVAQHAGSMYLRRIEHSCR